MGGRLVGGGALGQGSDVRNFFGFFGGRPALDPGAGAGGAAAAAAASFPPAISTSSAAAHRAAHIAQPPRAAQGSGSVGWSEKAPWHGRLRWRGRALLLVLAVSVLSTERCSVWERLFCRQLRAKAGRSGALRSGFSRIVADWYICAQMGGF